MRCDARRNRWRSCLLLSWWITCSLAYTRPERFLIISSPEKHKVYYAQLPSLQTLTLSRNEREKNLVSAEVLIDGEYDKCTGWGCSESSNKGLDTPYGVAVHQACGTATLYVSDSKAGAIYGYELYTSAFGGITVGSQSRIREGIEGGVKWLAVDGHGNLFYTSENGGKVFMISVFQIANRTNPPVVVYGADDTTAQTEGTGLAEEAAEGGSTAAPAGLASDGFQLYWADEEGDENSGAVVAKRFSQQLADPNKASDTPAVPPRKLTTGGGISRRMAINVCLARDNVFFTGEGNSLLAVKSDGSTIAEVAPGFKHPQGCAYDGEGTLYVADDEVTTDEDQSSNETEKGQGFIYSLAANLVNLRGVRYVTKVVAVEKPQQLAIFAGIADTVKCSSPSSYQVNKVQMHSAAGGGSGWQPIVCLACVISSLVLFS